MDTDTIREKSIAECGCVSTQEYAMEEIILCSDDNLSAETSVPTEDVMDHEDYSQESDSPEVKQETVCAEVESTSIDQRQVLNNRTDASSAVRRFLHRTNISLHDARILLDEFRPLHPDLPKDPRTILKTPRKTDVIKMKGGCYVHLGLIEGLKITMDERLGTVEEVHLQINIDGLQLYNSSNIQLWPILCRIVHPWVSNPFVVGTFCGLSKPNDVSLYLTMLINELVPIVNHNVKVDGQFRVYLQLIICDTPARSFVKQIKGHSGFHCCDTCDQRGVYVEHRLTLPRCDARLRTNDSFRNRVREEHHIGDSPFELLNVDMIDTFCLDPMHALYLGIAKKLLTLFRSSPFSSGVRLPTQSWRAINSKMRELKEYFPVEFPRRCRGFDDFERWKATEFRQFFLYIGPVLLKGHLSKEVYDNFMYFSVLSYIGSNPALCKAYANFLKLSAKFAIQKFANIYGEQHIIYNIHNFMHMFDKVEKYGSLDNYSSFPFESYLGKLKKLVRGCNNPAVQIYRRLREDYTYHTERDTQAVFDESQSRPIEVNVKDGMSIVVNNTYISIKTGNNSVIIKEKPAVVFHFDSVHVFYKTFNCVAPFYSLPLPSNHLYVYQCSHLSSDVQKSLIKDIFCKCFCIPFGDSFVFVPILHSMK